MKCQASDCYAEVKGHNSDYCVMHEGQGTFAYYYHEWDEEHWHDRLELLHDMWEQEQSEEQRKRVIADLLIHAHDLSEK